MTARRVAQVCRWLIAGVLLFTAIGKLLDNRGFAAVLETYRMLPAPLLLPMGLALSLFELTLALSLIRGRRLRRDGLISAGLHMMFIILASAALLRGLDIPNCGCFGVFLARRLTPLTLVEDGVLVLLSLGVTRA